MGDGFQLRDLSSPKSEFRAKVGPQLGVAASPGGQVRMYSRAKRGTAILMHALEAHARKRRIQEGLAYNERHYCE